MEKTVDRDETQLPELPDEALTAFEGSPGHLGPLPDYYAGLSTLTVTADQREILTVEPAIDREMEIRPDGVPFMPQVHYRRRLNLAFGPGAWALKPLGPLSSRASAQGALVFREWALYVNRHYVAQAVGEAEYVESNRQQTFGDVVEAVKSNALMRCCKDLGIAAECWDRRWVERYREQFCVQVSVQRGSQAARLQWRRRDAPPLPDEVQKPVMDAEVVRQVERPAATGEPARPEPPKPDVPKPGLKRVAQPSDVFIAGTAARWSTRTLNNFVRERFGTTVTQLEPGEQCEAAIAAVNEAAAGK